MKKLKKNSPGRTGKTDLSLEQIQEVFRLRASLFSFQKISEIVGCSKSRANELFRHKCLNKTQRRMPWYEKGKLVHKELI